MQFFAKLATTMIVFLVTATLFPNGFHVDNWLTALGASLVLALLNMLVKPVLLLLALPLTILTFGLFTIVINAFLLEMTGYFVGGFAFASFGWAIVTAIILAIVNTILTTDLYVD